MEKCNTKPLSDILPSAFNTFKEAMLSMSKEEIFNSAQTIHIKRNIYEYLCDVTEEYGFFVVSDIKLTQEEIRILASLGDDIIEKLFDYYVSDRFASAYTNAAIAEWVKRYCREKRYKVVGLLYEITEDRNTKENCIQFEKGGYVSLSDLKEDGKATIEEQIRKHSVPDGRMMAELQIVKTEELGEAYIDSDSSTFFVKNGKISEFDY